MAFQIWNFLFFTLHTNYLLTTADQTVFPSRAQANTVFVRSKRANMFLVEEILKGNLERECYEERCNKEEAREVFEDNQKTEDFWNIYYDGDQCNSSPCQHGGVCKDTIGGYNCQCTETYSGLNCEKDVSECPAEGPLACQQFCKPTQESYRCFCAKGYTLHSDKRSCIPQVQNPCGVVRASSDSPASHNKDHNGHNNQVCTQGRCPWQVIFVDGSGNEMCHGVVLGKRSILTTAGCMTKDKELYFIIGSSNERRNTSEAKWTLHNRYVTGHPNDDLAFLELKEPIALGENITQLCLPEKDFSENILMKTGKEGVVVGQSGNPSYLPLDDCRSKLNLSFELTNKMFCMDKPEAEGVVARRYRRKRCDVISGTPVASVEGNTAFLTGLFLSQSDCSQGLVFTKVSRYLPWIRQQFLSTEGRQR
ncbi:protein Z, vitamin K-dependent plasma glycoprotein b isoform X2 [Trichomycterus rosablanca]|uniref:protein Z, vitamin K-dependent plasma glycoprotein b isoform X2 n=1 Tax=Trichomycterus rosablanca TaxID=2290929 RepID=UPI002F3521DC